MIKDNILKIEKEIEEFDTKLICVSKTRTNEEILEAYKVFFKVFDVDIQNKDGSYKSIYDIFKEANEL